MLSKIVKEKNNSTIRNVFKSGKIDAHYKSQKALHETNLLSSARYKELMKRVD